MRYVYKLLFIINICFSKSLIFPVNLDVITQALEKPSHHIPAQSQTLIDEKIEAGSEFTKLKDSSRNFKQSLGQSACILYSFLYGVSQNQKLRKDLEDTLSKDKEGNYYVKDVKISKDKLINAPWDKHPAEELVLRAIGEYVIEKMENELFIPHFENYVLTNWEARDLFFNKPIVTIPYKEWIESGINKFQSDGSIKIGDTCYTGDFVVSWSRNGHARCMYFADEKWQNYDNQVGFSCSISKRTLGILRSYDPDVDVMLIGNITTT